MSQPSSFTSATPSLSMTKKEPFSSVKQVVSEKTFLSSLGELNKLMEEPERNFGRAATNFAASWMPNIVRQTVNSFDDTVRDHKSRSRGMEWWKDQFDITVSSAGIVRAAPKIDYFGREITKEEFLGAAALDAMFRLVLPVNPVNPDKNMDDAERLIWNYNRKMPDMTVVLPVPGPPVTIRSCREAAARMALRCSGA